MRIWCIMLSFSNTLKTFRQLKRQLVISGFSLKSSKCNISNPNHYVFSSSFLSLKFHSTESKRELFSLEELNNININLFNCDLNKWNGIVAEIEQAKASGRKLPQYLKEEEINLLIKSESKSQRYKYLLFLFKREMKKIKHAEKQLRKKEERELRRTENAIENNHIQYGLGRNCLVLRTTHGSIHKFYNKRLANAILFGQKLVIDLSYDQYMYVKEKRDLAAQLALVHGFNRKNVEPYDLHLCNAKLESDSVNYLRRLMPNVDDSLITLTEKSYLDMFPKENLVYLSPHAAEPLKTYDHDATYIIGGFVDTVKRNHISFVKSQEEGIKSYYLPLDEFVLWGNGSRSLTIDQVFSIMQTMRDTGVWKRAFQHIPTRKLKRIKADPVLAQCLSDKLYVMIN